MTRPSECECMGKLDENGECPACAAEVARAHTLYGGGRHRHLTPAGPWRSRESIIRDYEEER